MHKTPPGTTSGLYQRLIRTALPHKEVPKHFWRLEKADLYTVSSFFLITSFLWFYISKTGSFDSILAYWDGPNYLYAAATLYKIPNNNPWTLTMNFPTYYFACHLPGYPLLIRLCYYLSFSNYKVAFLMSIHVANSLFAYTFRRLLKTYNMVSFPTISTVLSAIIPFRFFIYHSVGNSETLFMTFVSLALIFYKHDRFIPMIACVWASCITRIEGIAIGFVIGICYLLRFKIFSAFAMCLTFVAHICLFYFHEYRFGNGLAYFKYNQESQQLIRWPPFSDMLYSRYQKDPLYTYSFVGFYGLLVFGVLLTYPKCLPAGLFASVFTVYVSFLNHIDIFRYAIPASMFGFLVGFDEILTDRTKTKGLCFIYIVVFLVLNVYAQQQIESNKAWPEFMTLL